MKSKKKFKKKLLLITLIVLATIFIASNVHNTLETNGIKNRIADSRKSTEENTDKNVNDTIAILKQLGVISTQVANSKVDVCYVTGEAMKGKWYVDRYQDCYLRYLNGFFTNLSVDRVTQIVNDNAKQLSYIGQPEPPLATNSSNGFSCSIFEKRHTPTLIYIPANFKYDVFDCEINPLQGLGSVKGPIIFDEDLSANTYTTFKNREVDKTKDQIWLMIDEHYYHEDLGCSLGLFECGNPRAKPIHPSI